MAGIDPSVDAQLAAGGGATTAVGDAEASFTGTLCAATTPAHPTVFGVVAEVDAGGAAERLPCSAARPLATSGHAALSTDTGVAAGTAVPGGGLQVGAGVVATGQPPGTGERTHAIDTELPRRTNPPAPSAVEFVGPRVGAVGLRRGKEPGVSGVETDTAIGCRCGTREVHRRASEGATPHGAHLPRRTRGAAAPAVGTVGVERGATITAAHLALRACRVAASVDTHLPRLTADTATAAVGAIAGNVDAATVAEHQRERALRRVAGRVEVGHGGVAHASKAVVARQPAQH
jgi:hypothetical protein